MRILYYDCFSGISGDMNLAALIDLGVDKEYLKKELEKLHISGYEIVVSRGNRKGIDGTRVDVNLFGDTSEHVQDVISDHSHTTQSNQENTHAHEHDHEHSHDHEHDHEHSHDHEHDHNHSHEQAHHHAESDHHHRNLKDIEDIINNSTLSDRVKKLSIDIFMKVAKAEAKVHGKPLLDVHFHEVGALDSIIDIIGAAICLDYLDVDKIMCSPIQVGGGFVKCAHGLFPVPAPATTEILQGIPIKAGLVPFETTTPTGAAILAATVDEFTEKMMFTILKTAYGIGHRDTEVPNVLRVHIGEIQDEAQKVTYLEKETAVLMECNIDDMNPELYEYILEEILRKGAMDAFLTPIIMKKGRPAIKVSVLCGAKVDEEITEFLLKETTTLGVRKYQVEKSMLQREFKKVETSFGEVQVKNSYFKGEIIKSKPEYDDCKRIAREKGVSIQKVYEEVAKAMVDEK